MEEITAQEMFKARELLEEAGATLLGKILFEFTRLDMCLGLCLVWVDSGHRLDALTKNVQDETFHQRLKRLKESVSARLTEGSGGYSAYSNWIQNADNARAKRNDLFHGRWAVDAMGAKLINILGLPTSNNSVETKYGLSDLQNFIEELKLLQTDLNKYGKIWPL